jgi:transposase
MSLSRLVITAVRIEGRSKSEVARDYGVSRVWVQKLLHRFDAEGEAAFEPRSRRPHASPQAVDADTEDAILRLRKELSKQGLDAGAETIAAHLARQAPDGAGRPGIPAVSTIWRILSRRGFVNPQPQKRPRSSWKSFCADQPNERWQADITHWQLADGSEVEILNILDDHSRLHIGGRARRITTGLDVVSSFRKAFAQWGIPAGVLTDIQSGWRGIRAKSSAGGEDRCRPAPARHRYLTDWSAQRLLAR